MLRLTCAFTYRCTRSPHLAAKSGGGTVIHGGRREAGSVGISRSVVGAGRGASCSLLPFRDLPPARTCAPHLLLSNLDLQGRSFLHSCSGHALSPFKHHKTNCSGLEAIELSIRDLLDKLCMLPQK